MSVMRSSLLGSLLQVLKFNLDRKAPRINVFELGRVFLRDAESQNTDTTVAGFNQPMRVAGLAYGSRAPFNWDVPAKAVDYFDVKGDVEALLAPLKAAFAPADHPAMHPGRCASVSVDGQPVGFVGELHPKWRQGYELAQPPLLFELELDAVMARQVAMFEAVSKLQPVERDIAVIVSERTTHAALMAAIYEASTEGLLKDAVLFDVYRPLAGNTTMQMGEKSLAVRLQLSSPTATLTEDAIETVVQSVVNHLQTTLQARLRA